MKIKVALKYCGSCNPHFDLMKLGRSLAETIAQRPDFESVPISTNDIDVIVILCGCPRACGNKEEVRTRGKRYLAVSDDSLSDTSILENSILACVKG